jgi:hypothetical protein
VSVLEVAAVVLLAWFVVAVPVGVAIFVLVGRLTGGDDR